MKITTHFKYMRIELLLFTLVGAIAFVVDVSTLYIVKDWLGIYWGRAVSFFCAVFVTWILNRYFTFKKRPSDSTRLSEFFQYLSLMLGGGSVNYFVYALLVTIFDGLADQPSWAVAAGSCAGLLVNFTLARCFIFKPPQLEYDSTVANTSKNKKKDGYI